jgi:superfamily II DNA/RNA helicase
MTNPIITKSEETITFADLNLNPQILKALDVCGYKYPTPVQALSIPSILEGKDLVASAQTGTGKTAAFVLPALQLLSDQEPAKKPRVLVLTPTRELAAQITQAATQYGKFLNFNIVSLVGGVGYPQQIKQLSRSVDIIVATPGRLLDHMSSRRVDLSKVELLVLDEADRMLDMGFIDDVREIAKASSADRQTLLFSATLNSQLSTVIKQLLKNPVKIDFAHQALAPDRIAQVLYLADSPHHKTKLLEHLLQNENIFKAIIFTSTKRHADQLTRDLQDDGFLAAALHGDLKQAARTRTVEQLRRGKIQYVVATDVAARGIDISDLTHVINYDLPKFAEDYVHRIGRTGRAGKTGIAISFALPSEISHLQKIERYTDQKIERAVIVGLEPTKRHTATAAPERRRSSPARSDRKFTGNSAGERSSFARKPSGDGARTGERSSFARKPSGDGARTGERSSFARKPSGDGARTGERSSFARKPSGDGARTGERSSFARKPSVDGARTGERSSFARKPSGDGARTGERSSFARKPSGDGARTGERSSFARKPSARKSPERSGNVAEKPASTRARAPKKPGKKY